MEPRHRHLMHGALALLGMFLFLDGWRRCRPGATLLGLVLAAFGGRRWVRERRAAGEPGWW